MAVAESVSPFSLSLALSLHTQRGGTAHPVLAARSRTTLAGRAREGSRRAASTVATRRTNAGRAHWQTHRGATISTPRHPGVFGLCRVSCVCVCVCCGHVEAFVCVASQWAWMEVIEELARRLCVADVWIADARV